MSSDDPSGKSSFFENILGPAILTGLLVLLAVGIFLSERKHSVMAGGSEEIWQAVELALVGLILVLGAGIIWYLWFLNRDRASKYQLEEAYRALVDGSQVELVIIQNNRVVFANPLTSQMSGFSRQELTAMSLQQWVETFHPDHRQELMQEITHCITRSAPVQRKAYRALRKDGTARDLELSIAKIPFRGAPALQFTSSDTTEQQSTRQALVDSEARYRSLFDNSHTIMLLVDPDHFVIRDANPAACEFYGYSREEFISKPLTEINTNDPAIIRRDVGEVEASGLKRLEVVHRLANGELRDMEVYSSPVNLEKKRLLLSIVHDISERKKIEQALRYNESTLQSIFRAAPDGIGMVRNRILTWTNQTLCQMTGYEDHELTGQSARILYQDDAEFERVGTVKYALIRESGTGSLETHWRRKNGEIIEILLSSTPLDLNDLTKGVIFTATDITNFKSTLSKLEKSESRYRQLFETMQNAFALHEIILDEHGAPVDYRFLDVNPAFEHLTGLQAGRVIGQLASQILPHLEPYWVQTYGQVALTGQPASLENYARDLDKYFHVVAYSPETGRFATLFQDITERKQAEKFQQAILETSNSLRTNDQREEMLPIILQSACRLLQVEDAALGCLLEDGREASIIEAGHGVAANRAGQQFALPVDLNGQFFASGRARRLEVERLDPKYNPLAEAGPALAVAPLAAGESPARLLWVARLAPFSETDLQVLTGIAEVCANALHRASMHEQTRRSLSRLEALHKIDQTINSALDLRITLAVVLDEVISNLNVDAAAVFRYNNHTRILEPAGMRGMSAGAASGARFYLGQGLTGRVAIERKILQTSMNHPASQHPESALSVNGYSTYTGAPLIAKGEIKGVLEVYHRKAFVADEEWLSFLDTLAGQTALALDNAAMFSDLQRTNLELALAYDTTLEGWAKALEGRDQETEGHCRRVTEAALELGRAMGLSDDSLSHLHRGALLHDIGKMAIPDDILKKPGPLNDDEWKIMRQHPDYAYEWLSSIPYLRQALDVPRCHHEKWDGNGYPRGLKGEQIPFSARIFAVVDVWDALLNERSYRPAWEYDQALAFIQDQSGKHFDPRVVEAFLELLSAGRISI